MGLLVELKRADLRTKATGIIGTFKSQFVSTIVFNPVMAHFPSKSTSRFTKHYSHHYPLYTKNRICRPCLRWTQCYTRVSIFFPISDMWAGFYRWQTMRHWKRTMKEGSRKTDNADIRSPKSTELTTRNFPNYCQRLRTCTMDTSAASEKWSRKWSRFLNIHVWFKVLRTAQTNQQGNLQ